ncbi:hypothetical protein CR513_28628, partial [Mucuna pruriens]
MHLIINTLNAMCTRYQKSEAVRAPAQIHHAPKVQGHGKQDLRGEVGQLREKIAQMFQILTQTNTAVTTLVNMNATGYAQNGYARNIRDPPYRML